VIVKEALGDVQEARGRHAAALQRHLERAQRRLVAAGLLRGDDPVARDAEPPVRAGEHHHPPHYHLALREYLLEMDITVHEMAAMEHKRR
jgi:hypothetical protein